jgi:hypothetical protein
LIVGYSDEMRLRPSNEELLRKIAIATGGKFPIEPQTVFQNSGRFALRPTSLWPWLASMAALLLVLDVALRRIDFSLHWPFRIQRDRNNRIRNNEGANQLGATTIG